MTPIVHIGGKNPKKLNKNYPAPLAIALYLSGTELNIIPVWEGNTQPLELENIEFYPKKKRNQISI